MYSSIRNRSAAAVPRTTVPAAILAGLATVAVVLALVVPSAPSQATELPSDEVPVGDDVASGYAVGRAPDVGDADPAEAEALAAAAETGEPVEITSQRGETREMYATPTGEIEVREFVVPKWTRGGDGWVVVDTTLEVSADGVAPVASTTDVLFSSGGGEDPLVSMVRHGRMLEWSWPEPLPEPVLAGDTATYRDVIEGVDLRMVATADGFASFLVVKTPEAAASPELDEVTFAMDTQSLDVGVTADGVLEATDAATGAVVFEAPPASMWSAPPAEGAVAARGTTTDTDTSAAEESSTGEGEVAPVGMQVSPEGDAVTLIPDQELLESPETSFPVTIDPAVSTPRTSAWTSPNESYPSTSYWQFKGETSAGLGTCTGWSDCPGGSTYRLFYQFDVSNFKGKNISSAVFQVPNVHSAVCVNYPVNVYHTKGISSSTTWNTQAASGFFKKWVVTESFNYGGNQSGCNNAGDAEFPVRSLVQEGADAGWNQVTLGMKADSESDKNQWKKFGRAAYLRVTYNTVPSQVSRSALSMKFGGACTDTTHDDPVRLRSVDGNILRVAEGAVKDPDPNEEVRVEFQLERPDGTVIDTLQTGWAKPGSYFAASVPAAKIPENVLVRWSVRVQDRKLDNSGPASSGPWSYPGCFFVLDTKAPPAPTIISEGNEYPEPDPSNPLDMPHDGVGEYGWFQISSSASDVAQIEYWFGNGVRTTKPGSSLRVKYLPLDPGQHSLYARAYDAAGNKLSTPTEYVFRVNYGRNPVGNWTFDDQVAGQQAPSPYALSGNAVRVDPEQRTPVAVEQAEGNALELDGAGDYATGVDSTGKSVGTVNTAGHFSVEAWVRPDVLPSGSGMSFVASQPGVQQMGFRLYYAGADGQWAFSQHDDDVAGASGPRAMNPGGATTGKWVHLLGVHDASRDKLVLYVNGVAGPEITLDSPWNAAGPVMVGASKYGSTYGNYFDGLIDSVRTYDRLVTPSEAAALATRLHQVKARWNFEAADMGTDSAGRAVAQGSKNPAGARVGPDLLLAAGATQSEELSSKVDSFALNLASSGAAYTDLNAVPVSMDESFTISGWAQAVGAPTAPTTVMSITGSSEEAVMVRFEPGTGTDEMTGGTWNLYLRESNSSSGVLHKVESGEGATAAKWNHFAVVYDAPRQTAHLYINAASSETVGVGRTEPGAVPFTNVARFNLGRGLSNGTWDSFFAGGLDDVWVFKGALNQTQIRALENGTPGLPTKVPGATQ